MEINEVYGSLAYYGIGKIIREYSRFPNWLPLPVALQHGWYIKATKHDALKHASENWYWTKDIEQMHIDRFKGIKTRSVGAPFLYLVKMTELKIRSITNRKGSIVFPAHSSKYFRVINDYHEYAKMLEQLPNIYKPITVCMYHIDQERGEGNIFLDKGFRVITLGDNLYDSGFLYNFIDAVKNKKYAFSNSRTSALLYSSVCGLKSYFYGPDSQYIVEEDAPEDEKKELGVEIPVGIEDWKLFFAFPNADLQEQRAFCLKTLGEENVLSEREMRRILFLLCFNRRYHCALIRNLIVNNKCCWRIYNSLKLYYSKFKKLLKGVERHHSKESR